MQRLPRCLLFAIAALLGALKPLPVPAATAEEEEVLKGLAQEMDAELHTNLLSYWLTHARNPANGGFYGLVDSANRPMPRAERGALLTARILWTFSTSYRRNARAEDLEMARYAYSDLKRFEDPKYGGYVWSITVDGRPLDESKQVYLHSFVLYSLAAYHRATGDTEALAKAKNLYALLESKAHDPKHGGYFEVFTQQWTRGGLFPPKSVVGPSHPKSQNTNLHMMECLAELLRVWPDEGLRAHLHELILVMRDRVRDPATNHLRLYFEADWKPINDECSYGHDIEFSWLVCEAATVAGGPELLAALKPTALAIVDTTLREGIDADGAIWDTGTPAGGVHNRRKDWWPQAEAIVAFVNAYELSGDTRYVDAATRTWAFVKNSISDRTGGEWWLFASDDRARRTHMPKITMWKCPYHNGRACMEVVDRVRALRPD
jgi:cellobiose epimerase